MPKNNDKIGKLVGVRAVPRGHKVKLVIEYETSAEHGAVEHTIGKHYVPGLIKDLQECENASNPFKRAHAEIKKGKE